MTRTTPGTPLEWLAEMSDKLTGHLARPWVAIVLISLFVAQLGCTPKQEAQEDQVASTIGRLGGRVRRETKDPDRPGVNIELKHRHVTDDTLQQAAECLRRWKVVETLDLGYARITDGGLRHLEGLSSIRSLSLAYTPITSDGLKNLRHLPNLQMLWLTGTQVDDSGVKYLGELRGLEVLYLGQTKISEAGLTHLQAFTSLRLLWLSDLPITDASLEDLAGLSRLQD